MDGINIKKSEALKALIMKIQCDVCWNFSVSYLLKTGQNLLIFLLFTPLTYEREWYTTLCSAGASTSILTLMTVGYPIILIHWNIVVIWLVFHCSISITKSRRGLVGSASAY